MKTIKEGDITFAYLGITDVEAIEAAIREENTKALNAQFDAIKDLTPADRMALWAQYRPERVSVNDIYAYATNSRTGIIATLTMAAKKAGSSGELSLDLPNAGNLAAHLLGLEDRIYIDVTDRRGKLDPNPPTAA